MCVCLCVKSRSRIQILLLRSILLNDVQVQVPDQSGERVRNQRGKRGVRCFRRGRRSAARIKVDTFLFLFNGLHLFIFYGHIFFSTDFTQNAE